MKTILTATLLSAALAGHVQAQNHTLTVDISQLKGSSGTVFVSLQDPTEKAVQQQAIPLNDKAAKAVFHGVPPGKYAVRFFHDENNNRQLDKGVFGIPKESWGCSNDVKASFGPPKFKDMLFTLTTDKTIAIHAN